jgi:hypothetical protein
MLPRSRWAKLIREGVSLASLEIDLESIAQSILIFIIVGISMTNLRSKILPKSIHPILKLFTFIPEWILNQIDPVAEIEDRGRRRRSSGRVTAENHRQEKLYAKNNRENVFINIIQIFILIFIARLIVKFIFFRATSIVLMILFDSTRFTYDLVVRIATLCVQFPLAVLVVLPIVRRTAWYYLLAYFTICGGSCFVLIFTISSGIMLVWKKFVIGTGIIGNFF